jgi:hypothetical protein
LEAGAEIGWAEAYAPIEATPGTAHGSWPDALADVTELVARAVPTTTSTNGTAGGEPR